MNNEQQQQHEAAASAAPTQKVNGKAVEPPKNIELTEAERNLVLSMDRAILAAKARRADALFAKDEADKEEALATASFRGILSALAAARGIEGNVTISPDCKRIVKV